MGLPSGYKRLEYIQSSGKQYINTGFIPKSTSKVVADFQVTEKQSTNNDIFGVVGQFSFRQYANSDFFRTVCGSAADFETGVSILSRHVVEKTMTETKIDGLYSVSTDASTVSNDIFLFAYNAGSYVSNYGYLKLYSCKIYDNDVLTRDFIPCETDIGAVGLWDDVNNVFYGNAGTGTFTAGPEIDPYGNDEHTLLLLHCEDLTDSSSYGCAVTASDVTISDKAKFGKSLGFNSYATMSAVLPINLSTADFTIDWWEYRNTDDADVSTIFTFGSKNVNTILGAYNESNRNIKLYASSAGSGWDVANGSIGTLVKNQWVHRAIVRTGGKIYAYQDGVLQNTFSGASKIYAPDNIITFSQCFGGGFLNGYIDEFRVSNIARWAEDFTLPTKPYSSKVPSSPTILISRGKVANCL